MRAKNGIVLPQSRVSSPEGGDIRWDPTGKFAECYDGSAWKRIGPTAMPYDVAFDPAMLASGVKLQNPRMPLGIADGSRAVDTTGQILLSAGPTIPAGMTLSSLSLFATAASSGLTHSYGGLATGMNDAAPRTVLARSSDNTGAWSANTYRTFTFSSAWTPTVDTPIFVWFVQAATTTMARILGRGFFTGNAYSASGGWYQFGVSSSAVQTGAPGATTAVAAQLGAINAAGDGDFFWYLS